MLVLWGLVLLAWSSAAAPSDVVVAINTFKWLRFTSNKFLGLSVSPDLLSSISNNSENTLSMLQGLAPMYLRVAGNKTQDMNFETSNNSFGNNILTKAQWRSWNQLATDAGLRLVFSLGVSKQEHDSNHSSEYLDINDNLEELLTYSDQQGFDPIWQYKCVAGTQLENRTAQISGKEIGREVIVLRNTLDKFPRYQKTAVVGPDFVINDKVKDLKLLKEFLQESNAVVSVLVLEMQNEIKDNLEEGVFKSLSMPVLALSKMLRMPSLPGQLQQLSKKQLWIVESDNEEYSGEFVDAMIWAVKLGHAGRLGYDVILRRPTELNQPTPDYWVSLLYRNLVGSTVLATRLMTGHSSVTVFANCVAYYERAARSVLDSVAEYERGAVVVWGVNSGQEEVLVTPLIVRQEFAHLYVLTVGPDETKPWKTFMNGKLLALTHGYLPKLSPIVKQTSLNMTVSVPGHSVFFIVLPNTAARACLSTAALTRTDELVNPQWKKTKSATGTEALKNDFVYEKGGMFQNSENIEKNGLKNALLSLRNETRIAESKLGENKFSRKQLNFMKNITNSHKKPKSLSVINSLMNVSKIETSENTQDDILLRNMYLREPNRNTQIESVTELSISTSEAGTSELPERNKAFEEVKQLENKRFKRSKGESGTKYFTEMELTPPYKKFHHLRRNKFSENSNNTNEQMMFNNFKHFLESKNMHSTKNSHKAPLNLDEIQEKSNAATNSLKSNGKGNDNFHYHPGAFYETLGNLKIDSNLSLADIEEQHDAFAVMLKETVDCKECKSKLDVTKRPPNSEEVDRNITESTTKYLEQYFKTTEGLKKHNISNESIENISISFTHDNIGEGKLIESKTENKNDQDTSNLSISITPFGGFTKKPFTVEMNMKNISTNAPTKPSTRIKRDADSFKYISQIFNKDLLERNDNSSRNKSQMEEIELRNFLKELTEEGEELLKNFDDEYEQIHNPNKNYQEQTIVEFSIFPQTFNKSTAKSSVDEGTVEERDSKTDYYIRNNLITNNTMNPTKKSYFTIMNPKSVENISSSFLTFKMDPIKAEYSKLQPPKNESKTFQSEDFISRLQRKISNFSTENPTQRDINSNFKLLESNEKIPMKKELSLNFLTSKPYQNISNYLDRNSTTNQDRNFERLDNQGTTIKPVNTLKQFQDKIIISPSTFTPLEVNKLSTVSLSDIDMMSNLPSQFNLPEKAKGKPSIDLNNSNLQHALDEYLDTQVDKDSTFEKVNDLETKMTSDYINEFSQKGRQELPKMQLYSEMVKTSDIDGKESILISKLSEKPRDKSLVFGINKNDKGRKNKEEELNLLNHPLEYNKQQDDTSGTILPPNKATNYISTQDVLNSLRKIPGLPGSIINKNFSFNNTLLNKLKERLEVLKARNKEAFEARLEKARERQPLAHIHLMPKLSPEKPYFDNNRNMFSYYKINNKNNMEGNFQQSNQQRLVASESKESVKKQLHPDDDSLSFDSNVNSRLKRQIFNDDGKDQREANFNQTAKFQSGTSVEKLINYRSIPEIIIESSHTPVQKWIIPLSNHTEKIVLQNKVFPVKLYGTLPDDWQSHSQNKNKKTVEVNNLDRKPRSVHFSCVRDHFDDYSVESESVDGVKVEKDVKQMNIPKGPHPSLLSNDNLEQVVPILLV